MAKVEQLTPRRFLPLKCQIDGNVVATKIIRFKYGFELMLCAEHWEELKAAEDKLEEEA